MSEATKKMSEATKMTPVGSLSIDCSRMSYLVDVPPGGLRGRKATQPGFHETVAEIFSNQPTLGSRVGITDDNIDAIHLANERITEIDLHLPAARKLVEVLEESRALLDEQRHNAIAEIAKLVDARTTKGRNTDLLAAYQETRAYRSATAVKAAKARRKNQAAEAQAAGESADA